MRFDYAIENEHGAYYAEPNTRLAGHDWTRSRRDMETFTESGAYKKMESDPDTFADCRVVRLP